MSANNLWIGQGFIKTINCVKVCTGNREYSVTDIVLSVERKIKGEVKVTFVPLEAWEQMSKACDDLKEGDFISVEGYFKNKKWINKRDVEMSKNLIVVEKIKKVDAND